MSAVLAIVHYIQPSVCLSGRPSVRRLSQARTASVVFN